MNKLSSIALSAALVVAGVAAGATAEARPYVAGSYAGGVVREPGRYGRPYFYAHDRYWHHEFYRDRYDRFHHERWEHR
jgi:hypothetical protein